MNEGDLEKIAGQINEFEKQNISPEGSLENPKVDSAFSREQAIEAIKKNKPECPPEILEMLEVITVKHLGFDEQIHEGQIIVHTELQEDIRELFDFALQIKFPIQSVVPISEYSDDDESSMSSNNSSGFNFRKIANKNRISLHGYGFAIDLNPLLNPVKEYPKLDNGEEDTSAEMVITQPQNGKYDENEVGTLYKNEDGYHPIVKFLIDKGWGWGGDWTSFKDYQHFEKPLPTKEYMANLQSYLESGDITQEQYDTLSARALNNANKGE